MLADKPMDSQRLAMLEAMGVDVYFLRTSVDSQTALAPAAGAGVDLVVACAAPTAADRHGARLRKLLPHALGLAPDRIGWIEPDAAGELLPPPPARAYLVLGATLTRSLGVHLSTTQQNTAVIAVADEPAVSLRDGLSKRALWQALKPVARRLHKTGV
jgi:hypothetical protein